jgi:hypothetical protein
VRTVSISQNQTEEPHLGLWNFLVLVPLRTWNLICPESLSHLDMTLSPCGTSKEGVAPLGKEPSP